MLESLINVLYNDDCETVNPLGSKTGIHKLGLIYFAIWSFPLKLLSSLNSLFLAAVYKSDDAKTYGINTKLKLIVEDLKDMELELQGRVIIVVAEVVGDNLGLNAVLGYNESFVANSVCRWCRIHKPVMQVQSKENESLLRTPSNFKTDLELHNSFETDFKQNSVLNELHSFHVVDNVDQTSCTTFLEGWEDMSLSWFLVPSLQTNT